MLSSGGNRMAADPTALPDLRALFSDDADAVQLDGVGVI